MIVRVKKLVSVGVALGLAAAPLTTVAYAADAVVADAYSDCTCVTAPKSGAPALGSVANPGSGVQISGANGFQSAANGDAVNDGTELSVGAKGGGSISVGQSCNVGLNSYRLVSVSMPEGAAGKICVKVADLSPKAAPGGAGFSPVVIGLGAAVAGGLAILLLGGGGAPASM